MSFLRQRAAKSFSGGVKQESIGIRFGFRIKCGMTMGRLKSLSQVATSFLHSDFQNKKAYTEVASLVGYVVSAAERLSVEVPTYQQLFAQIQERIS
ncbi:ketopantoate reductase C-terminal domain-containing protein [Flagellimonas flava]|uniref:ketopantoate reductase C-terminal domain-containing protein n=1 Tax=Flagellimonas flava TaxID=570519 RepID=UPI003D64763E